MNCNMRSRAIIKEIVMHGLSSENSSTEFEWGTQVQNWVLQSLNALENIFDRRHALVDTLHHMTKQQGYFSYDDFKKSYHSAIFSM